MEDAFVSEDAGCCDFSADAGQVCALQYHDGRDGTRIRRFALCAPDMQAEARRELAAVWPDVDVGRWASASDVLYVMERGGFGFVGCVAVDRRLFVPFISHLLVSPGLRGRGHGRTLLDFAMRHVARQGFDEAKLWCDPSLCRYYGSMGWEVDGGAQAESSPSTVVMRRATSTPSAFTPVDNSMEDPFSFVARSTSSSYPYAVQDAEQTTRAWATICANRSSQRF